MRLGMEGLGDGDEYDMGGSSSVESKDNNELRILQSTTLYHLNSVNTHSTIVKSHSRDVDEHGNGEGIMYTQCIELPAIYLDITNYNTKLVIIKLQW